MSSGYGFTTFRKKVIAFTIPNDETRATYIRQTSKTHFYQKLDRRLKNILRNVYE